jgi:hypothetical protein
MVDQPEASAEYIYKGDRLTADVYKGKSCIAIRRIDGKCIRGKNGSMLVIFGTTKVVVLARQLRRIKSH